MLARSPTTTCSAVGSARRASAARLSLRTCNVTACPRSASSCAAISPSPSLEPVIRTRDIRTPFRFACTASLTLILRVDQCAVQAAGRLPERIESTLFGPGELLDAAAQPGVGVGSLLLSVERRHIQPERGCAPRASFARTGAIRIVHPDARLAPVDISLNQLVDQSLSAQCGHVSHSIRAGLGVGRSAIPRSDRAARAGTDSTPARTARSTRSRSAWSRTLQQASLTADY